MNSFLRPPVQPLESVGDTIIQTNNKCHPINASCKMGFNRVFRWKCFRTQLPRVKFKTCESHKQTFYPVNPIVVVPLTDIKGDHWPNYTYMYFLIRSLLKNSKVHGDVAHPLLLLLLRLLPCQVVEESPALIRTFLAFWVPIGSLFIFQGPYFQCFGFIHAKKVNSVCMYTAVS